jgi:hypothetical protein
MPARLGTVSRVARRGIVLIVRGRIGHGVALLVLSLIGPMLSLVGAMTLLSAFGS